MQAPPLPELQGEISITFQDREPPPSPGSDRQINRPPIAVSVLDVKRVYDALQFGVWTTAALQRGLSSHNDLSDAERRQYELAIIAHSEGSLKTDFMFLTVASLIYMAHPHDPLALSVEVIAIQNAWNTLSDTIDTMSANYRDLASGQGGAESQRHPLTSYVRKIARSAIESTHQILLHAKGPSGRTSNLQTDDNQNERVLGPGFYRRSRKTQDREENTDRQKGYWYENGEVMDADSDHVLIVKFEDYTHPIPCFWDANIAPYIGGIVRGDSLNVFGYPEHFPDDRPDAPPRTIAVTEVTKMPRTT